MNLDRIDTITPAEYSKYFYIEKMLNLIKADVRSACDVGCGAGNLLSALEKYNIKTKGIDISDTALELARNRIRSPFIQIEKRDIFDLKESFDLVYLSEVLEHIENDSALLSFLNKNVIGKGGYLILAVPAHKALYSPFDKSVGHIRRYDKKDIISILEKAGFKTLVFWSYGSILFYFAANLPFYLRRAKNSSRSDEELRARTMKSSIRKFSCLPLLLVSRVNLIHRVFLALDYSLKNFQFGNAYCILCKS